MRGLGLLCMACTFRAPLLEAPDDASAGPACPVLTDHVALESTHVHLSHPANVPVCSGTMDYLERAAIAQSELLGVELGTLCYRVWHPEAWAAGPCPLADACTQPDGMIHSPRPDVPHELVHAMRHTAWSVAFFEEGIAVALGDDAADEVLETYPVSVEALLVGEEDLDNLSRYRVAGDFSSYLVARDGPERYRALLEGLPRQLPAAERPAAFSDVYGLDLAAMLDERWASGWRFHGGDLGLPACVAPPVAWDGRLWQDAWTIDCQNGAVGVDLDLLTVGIVNYMRRFATIDVPEGGVYRLDLAQSRRGAWLELGFCPDPGGDGAPYEAFSLGISWVEDFTAFAQLRPGHYSLTSWASWPEPASIDATLQAVTPSCAEPVAVAADSTPLFLLPYPGAALEVTIGPTADLTLVASQLNGVALSICPDCTDCRPVVEDDRLALATGTRATLVATATHWGGQAYLYFRSAE